MPHLKQKSFSKHVVIIENYTYLSFKRKSKSPQDK